MLREIEISTFGGGNLYVARLTGDTHATGLREYAKSGASRLEAFEACKEAAKAGQISLVGGSAAWWHINGDTGQREPLATEF